MEPYKIILVDDHSLFRNGLRGLLERCAACRVVGEAASGEEFLAMLGGVDADVVEFTWSITDNQGWSVISFCLSNCFYSLSRISTKCNLCYIYIAITHSDFSKALLANLFTGSSKLTNFTDIGSFRCLTTSIGVHLRIEYHYVYVLAGCKYMIQTTKSDIICPTVTTEEDRKSTRLNSSHAR